MVRESVRPQPNVEEKTRAKHLTLGARAARRITVRSNRPLREARVRVAELIRDILAPTNRAVLATAMGVSDVVVRMWLSPAHAEYRPLPAAAIPMLPKAEREALLRALEALGEQIDREGM